MPIGGFILTLDPRNQQTVLHQLAQYTEVEVHGVDAKGQAVVVIDSETSDAMETLLAQVQKIEGVLSLGATYFNAEDEIEKIERGELKPTFSFGRKGER